MLVLDRPVHCLTARRWDDAAPDIAVMHNGNGQNVYL